jgi:uncharacterized protein
MDTVKQEEFRFSPRENRAGLINWYIWGEEAFQKAINEDKLIYLSISAVWCHWCHVMDETSYSDDRVIDFINNYFIPVRVDNDKRPDINRRYNMGGWPSFALLEPDGEILAGSTYLPADELIEYISEIEEIYRTRRDELDKSIEKRKNKRIKVDITGNITELNSIIINNIAGIIDRSYDREYGGFGIEPKFPHSDALEFLLMNYFNTENEEILLKIKQTLNNMSTGGIYDQVEGGFFRYSTRRNWDIPHFEKMLEDNSRLLKIYIDAYNLLHEEDFKETIEGIVKYMVNKLGNNSDGLFYGSQDADEKYYALELQERIKRPAPYIDMTIYSGWNGLAFTSILKASELFADKKLKERLIRGIEFLWNQAFIPGEGLIHYIERDKHGESNIFSDQINFLEALLTAYEHIGDSIYLKRAGDLIDIIIGKFYDREMGGFFASKNNEGFINLEMDKDIMENAKAVDLLLSFNDLLINKDYRGIIEKTLYYFLDKYQNAGIFAAYYGIAISHYLNGSKKLTLVGNFQNRYADIPMIKTALNLYLSHKIIEVLDIIKNRQLIEEMGYQLSNKPICYVCIGEKCFNPLIEPGQLNAFKANFINPYKV